MKQKKPVYTQTDFTDRALGKLEAIMADDTTSHAHKMVALMMQAEEICDHKDPLPDKTKAPDLFSDIPRADPYTLCVTYFTQIIDHAKKNKNVDGFDPSTTTQLGQTSPLHYAFDMKRRKGKTHKELKEFDKLIEKNFPEELAENARIERSMEEEDAYLKQRSVLYRQGKLPTHADAIFHKKVSPSQRYVLLMNHAAKALKETPYIDLKKPYANPELLVSLVRTSKNNNDDGMLYHVKYDKHDVVKPHQNVLHPDAGKTTPMQYAEELTKIEGLQELGVLFQTRLLAHEESLKAYTRNPAAFEPGYQKRYKPS